jgi:hypothetical protein
MLTLVHVRRPWIWFGLLLAGVAVPWVLAFARPPEPDVDYGYSPGLAVAAALVAALGLAFVRAGRSYAWLGLAVLIAASCVASWGVNYSAFA